MVENQAQAVGVREMENPLADYEADLWDPRQQVWRQLEVCVGSFAERAGTSVPEEWNRPWRKK